MGQALHCHPSRLAAPETRGLGAGVGVAYAHGDGFQMREGKGRGVTRNPGGPDTGELHCSLSSPHTVLVDGGMWRWDEGPDAQYPAEEEKRRGRGHIWPAGQAQCSDQV